MLNNNLLLSGRARHCWFEPPRDSSRIVGHPDVGPKGGASRKSTGLVTMSLSRDISSFAIYSRPELWTIL